MLNSTMSRRVQTSQTCPPTVLFWLSTVWMRQSANSSDSTASAAHTGHNVAFLNVRPAPLHPWAGWMTKSRSLHQLCYEFSGGWGWSQQRSLHLSSSPQPFWVFSSSRQCFLWTVSDVHLIHSKWAFSAQTLRLIFTEEQQNLCWGSTCCTHTMTVHFALKLAVCCRLNSNLHVPRPTLSQAAAAGYVPHCVSSTLQSTFQWLVS